MYELQSVKNKMNQKTANAIKYFYQRRDVKFEIVKQLFNREFAVLKPAYMEESEKNTRMLRCHNVKSFEFIMQYLKFFKNDNFYNLYKSCAEYNTGIPIQKLDYSRRNNEDWNKNHVHQIKSYDLLIDIDAGSHDADDMNAVKYSAEQIIKFYDFLQMPYLLIFTGKGFQLLTPQIFFPSKSVVPTESGNLYMLYSQIAEYLYENFSEMVDLGIYDSRRLCKIAYSCAIYEDGVYVSYPLNYKADLDLFKLSDFELFNFDKEIVRRGIRLYNKTGNADKLLKKIGV